MTQFGFVAGTLVHTDKGLVSIEQIKVGDNVLSKHESDEGEQAYKRVLSTFISKEKKRITYVNYDVVENGVSTGDRYLFCTEDHPFWTVAYDDNAYDGNNDTQPLGWLRVSSLSHQKRHLLYTFNGNFGFVSSFNVDINEIIEEDNSKVTFLYNENDDALGIYDFRSGTPVCIGGLTYEGLHATEVKSSQDMEMLPEILDLVRRRKRETYYDYVHNIEVEDFHTYFVGEAGIWVHALP